jgi:septum site-determining protein MinC
VNARRVDNSAEVLEAADLRFGQVGIASVRVKSNDADALCAALEARVHAAPQLFERAAVVVDLSFLPDQPDDDEAKALLDAVRAAGMLPVGLAYGDSATDELARRLKLPLIAKFRAAYVRDADASATASATAPAAAATQPERHTQDTPAAAATRHHLQPVRTGQQVYAQGSDLVVVGAIANGAEVLADGNVHIYGALRGRAFAGALGDEHTRIFCSEFRAEIISIAGHYRVFEELPDELAGRAVQIWLEQGKLQLAAL